MMLLSVLIPTYDYKCYALVYALHEQLEACGEDYEVIVMDDGGRDQVIAINNLKINELSNCHYIRNRQNVGRACVRNQLIKAAHGEWCLIIDSDAKVVRNDYIAQYISCIKNTPDIDVFVGDLVNPDTLPHPDATLRYCYEKQAEPHRTVKARNSHPFRRFSTFNVLIKHSVLEEVPFDEACKDYGWEDALMGIELEKHGKSIMHIDNPLMHMGFDSNKVYLAKVETSLRTLHALGDKMLPYTGYGKAIKKIDKHHALWFVKLSYKCFRSLLRNNLLGKKPNLNVFGFYKLGYFLYLN